VNLLITGGAGFIGSAMARYLIENTKNYIAVVDSLTYAGNLKSISGLDKSPRFEFHKQDILNTKYMTKLFRDFKPNAVIHFAAESHVDNSIRSPEKFLKTNILGTYSLLNISLDFYSRLSEVEKSQFKFHHISTDEVYGDLSITEDPFTEENAYKPSSPYSASKASSDHLVSSWHRTYGLPTIITNCSNNYGPYQNQEKLIPTIIKNALFGNKIPIYGQGKNIRDWLFVEDHVSAIWTVLKKADPGSTYNIGGNEERTNLQIVNHICSLLDQLEVSKPSEILSFKELISFVKDRKGHDFRYAIDSSKIYQDFGWLPSETFETGILKTVKWYLKEYKI